MAETIPGGYYIGADGKAHDAHGNKIPVRSTPPKEQAIAKPVAVAAIEGADEDELEVLEAEETLGDEGDAEASDDAQGTSVKNKKGKGKKGRG